MIPTMANQKAPTIWRAVTLTSNAGDAIAMMYMNTELYEKIFGFDISHHKFDQPPERRHLPCYDL